ncbi:MAG: Crp/Fnr family transcriptional regulator [Deltaproteobacteria bacterium]|nr:Crp/Fnr family transcriptional regulator [Deltaproteobacteria bacterium]
MTENLLSFLQTLVSPENIHVQRGDFIFQPGDPASFLYAVEQGQIRMIRFNEAGSETVLYRAGAGETFAEAALFVDFFHCTVIAEEDCKLLAFPKKAILTAMDKDTRLLRQYSMLLSREVRELRSMIEVRSIGAADARLLHYFRLHADDNGRVLVSPSLMDLAGQLGMAHETLYRNLKKLENNGAIRRKGLEIILL